MPLLDTRIKNYQCKHKNQTPETRYVIIFRPYLNMEGKSSTQRERFFLRLLANCSGPNLDSEFDFQPNYSKSVVECD